MLYESPAAVVFVDPLIWEDDGAFWRWADERVAERPVHVLTTVAPHRRSRKDVVARYQACTSRARGNLPQGVEPIPLRGARETEYWLPEHSALIVGDRILADGRGGLRMCPESWLQWLSPPVGHRELRELLRPLLDLPVERVLVSHGEPVLSGGADALARMLADQSS